MKLHFTDVPGFPPLAWLAIVDLTARTIHAYTGGAVEYGDGFLVEGIWNGDFAESGFDKTDIFFGSGLVVRDGETVFVSSCSTLDALHYHADADHLIVSNSLSCLLAACGDRLDPNCDRYADINVSTQRGIDDYLRDVPTVKGAVKRLLYRDLVLAGDVLRERGKPPSPHFPDFETYRDYLRDGLQALVENAHSVKRRARMAIYSSQSRGYDSTLINSLLPAGAVDKVFTVPSSRKPGGYSAATSDERTDDSGEEICRYLGLPVERVNSHRFLQREDLEALCFAGLHFGDDVNLVEMFEKMQGPAVFCTGAHGGIMWATDRKKVRDFKFGRMQRGDLSVSGLTELRLASGVVSAAIPFIGATREEDILTISKSPAMDPWRLNNSYDRPIPRRVGEEAGLPRDVFGQEKMATSLAYCIPPVPFGRTLRRDYFRYLRERGLISAPSLALMPLWHKINELIHFHTPHRYRALYYVERLISRLKGRKFHFSYVLSRLNGALYCFCVNQRADFYAARLTAAGTGDIASQDVVTRVVNG